MKYIIVYAIICMLAGCKKIETSEESLLPPATQTGANTFGCLVNGKAWVPNGGGSFTGIKPIEGGYQGPIIDSITKCLWIRARKDDKTGVQFFVEKVHKPGIYKLNFNTGIRPGVMLPDNYGYYFDRNGKGDYVTNKRYNGNVTFTRADTITGFVAGTFEFTAYNGQDTIRITKGRFDLNTYILP